MSIDSMDKARPWLGKTITYGGKDWRVASIRMEVVGHPWAWLSNKKKPMDQARLSMRAECFK